MLSCHLENKNCRAGHLSTTIVLHLNAALSLFFLPFLSQNDSVFQFRSAPGHTAIWIICAIK